MNYQVLSSSGHSMLSTRRLLGIHLWVGLLIWNIENFLDLQSGKNQEGAFQPGFTTLRNPLVQPDVR